MSHTIAYAVILGNMKRSMDALFERHPREKELITVVSTGIKNVSIPEEFDSRDIQDFAKIVMSFNHLLAGSFGLKLIVDAISAGEAWATTVSVKGDYTADLVGILGLTKDAVRYDEKTNSTWIELPDYFS